MGMSNSDVDRIYRLVENSSYLRELNGTPCQAVPYLIALGGNSFLDTTSEHSHVIL